MQTYSAKASEIEKKWLLIEPHRMPCLSQMPAHPIYFLGLLWYLIYEEIAMLGVQARHVPAQK